MLFVSTPLQPPDPVAVASQVANCTLTVVCVWPSGTVVFTGQVSTTVGGEGIVNVAEQVSGVAQSVV